jgi:4-carboxymuconolactone decarboxylase
MAERSSAERRAEGIRAYARQFDVPEEAVVEQLSAMVGERMAEEAIESAGGGAWVEDCLSLRDRSLVVLACLVTQGGVEERLRGHVRLAVRNGVTPEEIEALVMLLAIYAGYPRASTAMEAIRDELGADAFTAAQDGHGSSAPRS